MGENKNKRPAMEYVVIGWSKDKTEIIYESAHENAAKSFYFPAKSNSEYHSVGLYRLMPDEPPLEAKNITE